eukprot:CAMPEP_0181329912 /NCGR_PEP_ID=MMETSP1101-20121128/23591_1 /TAXON_ID=46948 /ORGANISM="Rhodomonas abbreviata, Strain Caron Lab Isolate" /LENGTH=195 /DNA_ID=CAMNT_0023439077 /DNA_START=195 /DNA_END=779 /DNA_ORIENTATION=+
MPKNNFMLLLHIAAAGVYLCALFDTAVSFLKFFGLLVIITQPELLVDVRGETYLPNTSGAAASEYEMGMLRAQILIALGTICFGFRGALATRTCDPEGLRPYLNWKVFEVGILLLLGTMIHRVWWDGCGMLSVQACDSLKLQLVLGNVLAVLPALYLLWVVWSLHSFLSEGDEFELLNAGYMEGDIEQLHMRRVG